MCSLLLKKAVPFALTFLVSSFIAGLFAPGGALLPRFERGPARYHRHYHCDEGRWQARTLVAETRPLTILFKPDARRPHGADGDDGRGGPPRSALVRVTFGSDGRVQAVEPFYEYVMGTNRVPLGPEWKDYWDSAERAARLIQFAPEMDNGMPVTVTKELEIFFLPE